MTQASETVPDEHSDGKNDFIAACDRAIAELDRIIAACAPDLTDEVSE